MEINSTRPLPTLGVEEFRQALRFNPLNSKYYVGLSEILEKPGKEDQELLDEAEIAMQAAILRAPSNWGYRQKLAEFYLSRQPRDPGRYIPMALKELAASVILFPESGVLHFRLASVLSWAERHYSGLVPPELRGCSEFHARMTAKLEPRLTKFLPKP
jgi:hypothetical protein